MLDPLRHRCDGRPSVLEPRIKRHQTDDSAHSGEGYTTARRVCRPELPPARLGARHVVTDQLTVVPLLAQKNEPTR
jgi:hypothetical protein